MNKNDQLRAVVFDVDGTLFDTLPSLAAAANAVLANAGLNAIEVPLLRPALSEGLLPMFRHALALQAERVPAGISVQLERDYLALYMQGGLMATKPFAGAAASLQAFATQGLRLAICTNRDRFSTDALLAAATFPVDFEVIVGMGDAPRAKPAPDPLLRVLELMDLSPAQALFIGDSAIDARCAQAAQVRFAAHRNGYFSHPDDLLPQVMGFDSYDQLTPWVLKCLPTYRDACHA
jgi:phosphoglycolate phosphatase